MFNIRDLFLAVILTALCAATVFAEPQAIKEQFGPMPVIGGGPCTLDELPGQNFNCMLKTDGTEVYLLVFKGQKLASVWNLWVNDKDKPRELLWRDSSGDI